MTDGTSARALDPPPVHRGRDFLVYGALSLATLVSFAPLLSAVVAGSVAAWFGCRLDEGDAHPCPVLGLDVGDPLYALFVLGWFMLLTWPGMLATPLCWLALLVRALIRRRRRRSVP